MHRLVCLIYIIGTISLAQEKVKKRLYVDETWKPITKSQFIEKRDVQFNLPTRIENDTAIIERLIPRRTYGFLKRETRLELIEMLTLISERKFDPWNTLVINFHFEKENSIEHYTSQKTFIKKMRRTFSVEQFFITEMGYGYQKDKVTIYEDKFDAIRRLLFNDYFEGDNYAIIKPNGQFYRYYGEYDITKIFGQAVTDWGINFNDYQRLLDKKRNSLPFKFITIEPDTYDESSNSNATNIAKGKARIIYTEDLVTINDTFKSRYPDLVTYYFHNDGKNFSEVRGDFLNINVPKYINMNMGCSFWARRGKRKNLLQVMLRLSGDSETKFDASSIEVYSKKHGELYPAIEKSFSTRGKYATLIFQKEIKLSRPAEILKKIKNDIVTVYIDGVKYEFISPEFD